MSKDGYIKIGSVKYKLNYSIKDLKKMEIEYKKETVTQNIRTLTSYFSEACLMDKNIREIEDSLNLLIRWYNRRMQQLLRLGKTHVFGQSVKSVLFHKGSSEVRSEFTQLENHLLGFIIKRNKGKNIYIKFYPGFIININTEGKVSWLFDYKQNIRNY